MNESFPNAVGALEFLKEHKEELSNREICRFSDEQKEEYDNLLKLFLKTNGSSTFSRQEKGKALENIVSFLLEKSGGIFKVGNNVRTNTNEIDQIVTLSECGRLFLSIGIIDNYYKEYICECKNHAKKVGVTFVGKLYSLMQTCDITFSILFSYHGISGSKWTDGTGLVKKIYLSSIGSHTPVCIIDFNVVDFKSIKDGNNFLDIISSKIQSLKFDTDVYSFVSPHPAADKLKK